MTSTTLELRPFTPEDYPAYVALLNAARPHLPRTEQEVRLFDEQAEPGEINERRLWSHDGALLAAVDYGTNRFDPAPGKYQVQLALHPRVQHDELADELLRYAVHDLQQHRPRELVSAAREDRWELPFFLRHGFHEVDRMFASTLDLTTFDPTPFEWAALRSRTAGVTVLPLSAFPYQDGSFQRRWYDLIIELLGDVPMAHPLTPWPFEVWQRRVAHHPLLQPEAYFLAVHGDELVGVSELRPSSRPGTIGTGLTGVRRNWRRRGVAQTLKLAAAQHAREQGYRFVRTSNHSVNRPMLSINEAMGFVKEPATVNLQREA